MAEKKVEERPVQGPNPNPNTPGPPRNPEEGPIDVQELLAKIGAKDISLGKVRNSYENLYQAFMQVQQENSRLQIRCADLEGKLKDIQTPPTTSKPETPLTDKNQKEIDEAFNNSKGPDIDAPND